MPSIDIPDSVISLGEMAFYECTNLKSANIGNSLTKISDNAFSYCSSLETLNLGNSITGIGQDAFLDCANLTSVVIPNSVTWIGDEAFYGCSKLTAIDIPDSVTSIGSGAFAHCSSMTSLTLGNSLRRIYSVAFYDCSSLTSVIIPDSVTEIDLDAFAGCSSLTSLTLSNSLTTIGYKAFYGCVGLTSLTIPKSVTWIGFGAFGGCTNIESITVQCVLPPEISSSTFKDIPETIPVYVPACSLLEYQNAEYWNQFQNLQADEFNLSVTPNFIELGSVSIVQQPDCEHDAIVLATPNEGVPFSGWMEDGVIVSIENPYTFTMTGNRNLVACFGYYGVDDNELPDVEIYPNPVSDRLIIKCDGMNGVEIVNLLGQRVANKEVEGSETNIEICHLTMGIYFVSITFDSGKRCIRKVMKR